jgi:hypothetical protein
VTKSVRRTLKDLLLEKIGELHWGEMLPDELEEKIDEAFDELEEVLDDEE